ncbi:MAG: hypothetical protein FDZ75_02520 [Actinobacteria bacterium]|nr:MAG: hypothetical protein FDZ75_02520 [Actinomycetota bacterium]
MTADINETPEQLTADEQQQVEKPKRSLWGLLAIVATIVIIILILLLLRDCGGGAKSGDQGGKEIVPVSGFKPVEGLVSVWVKSGTGIDTVLGAASVRTIDLMDLGEGRYVITVEPGREKAAAAALIRTQGVYDAGLVYQRPGAAK